MEAVGYMLGVFAVLVGWSALSGISRKGAQREIAARGLMGVGYSTIKVAEGTATAGEKFGIAVATVFGSMLSLPFILGSVVIGGGFYLLTSLVTYISP